MSAFVIVEIEVREQEPYEEYKRLAPPSIKAYGGRYLVRGGRAETFEGDWRPKRVVVLEFPSLERARQWLESPEYRDARAMRQRAATTRMIAVECLGTPI